MKIISYLNLYDNTGTLACLNNLFFVTFLSLFVTGSYIFWI